MQIKIRRVIEEVFDVSDEDAKFLMKCQRAQELTDIWDWFYTNQSGVHEIDTITVRKVK